MIFTSEIGKFFVTIGSKFEGEGFTKARDNLNKLAIGAAAAGAAVAAIAIKAANAAGIQEMAERKLAVALENSNNKAGITLKTLTEYASELQKVTTVGDETAIQMMQMGLSMGISADKIQEATKGAIGLSKAFDMDLNTAMKMTALATEGNFDMLGRYIPALRAATSETEKADIVNRAMANGFQIAQAETETYQGKIKQLQNRAGDLFETIGRIVIPVITDLVNFINVNVLPAFEGWTSDIEKSGKATDFFKNILRGAITVVMAAFDAFNLAGQAVTLFFLAITGNWKAAKIGIDELKDSVVKMGSSLKTIWADTEQSVKKAEEAKQGAIKNTVNIATISNKKILEDTKKTDEERKAFSKKITQEAVKQYEKQVKEYKENMQKMMAFTQEALGQIQSITASYSELRLANIQNDLNNSIAAETLDYETKRNNIIQNVADETEREAQLAALDEAHAARVDNLRTSAEQKEISTKRKMKTIQIAEAIANTALGATKALAQWGFPLGPIMAGLVTAAGMMKVAVIKAQKFAKGGMARTATPAIFGEAGPEVALPLDSPRTIAALSGALQGAFAMAGGGGYGGLNISVTVPPISTRQEARRMGEIVGNEIYRKVRGSRKV